MTALRARRWGGKNGESIEHVLGCRYDPDLSVKDIAKQIRKIIREAMNAGYLPTMRTSVRIARYAGGEAITIQVKEASVSRQSQAGQEAFAFLNICLDAYQKSETWWQGDYFVARFWSLVLWIE